MHGATGACQEPSIEPGRFTLSAGPTQDELRQPRRIPRRIIQSWAQKDLTPAVVRLCKTHRDCNPGYDYVFYDDEECRAFIETHFRTDVLRAYDALIPGAFKADLFRYCELYIKGGWWFDIDTMSVGSIDALVEADTEFACPRDGEQAGVPALYQAVLGVSPRHAVLKTAIDRIVAMVAHPPKPRCELPGGALGYTGPTFFAKCAIDVLPDCAVGASNQWPWVHNAEFGDSRGADGHCVLGAGTLAIGHGCRRSTVLQERVDDAYNELKAARTTDPRPPVTYYQSEPYRYPNALSDGI